MTFLTVILWVIGVIFIIIAAVLFLPITAHLAFKEDFTLKAFFAGIKVYELKEKEPQKAHAKQKPVERGPQEKKDNAAKQIFTKLKEKHGFVGTIKVLMSFFKDCLVHIKFLLRHIKFENVRLNLVYGGTDAADTAIKYGEICTAVYPVLTLLDTASNVKLKKIDVKSDFTEQKTEFDFSLKVKTRIFFLIIAAFRLYKTYKNFLYKEEIE